MVAYKDHAQKALYNWFQKAPDWQKDMFCSIWNGANDESHLAERAIKLINQEYLSTKHTLTSNITFPDNIDFSEGKAVPIILKSISNVQGVGAIAAKSPLEFGDGLTVVYGENGCGKSSYVRILKAIENPECASVVVGNVFANEGTSAVATISFSLDEEEYTFQWDKANKKKYPILIYDTDIAHQFVDKENEVVYEPKVLSVISKMANVFAQLLTHYQSISENTLKKYTLKPKDIEDYSLVQEFNRLTTVHDLEGFGRRIFWDGTKEAELAVIFKSLEVSEPEKAAKTLEAQKKAIQGHKHNILNLIPLICPESCTVYLDKRQKQIDTKKEADELTRESRSKSVLGGFGSDRWRIMWTSAVNYVVATEEISSEVPISKDERCVLCQQILNIEAKSRLQSFNEYIASQAITNAEIALCNFECVVRELQDKIENSINITAIENMLVSNAIDEDTRKLILGFYNAILGRCKWLLNYGSSTEEKILQFYSREYIIAEFTKIETDMDMQIKTLKETAQDKGKQISRKNELLAIKWTSENLAIKNQLITLAIIQSKCKTNSITTLKKDLSDILITDAYINRFSNEMHQLDTSMRIKAELVSKGAKRGRSYHQISLRGALATNKLKTGEILSEGEYRVVSLAAFLADLSSWGKLMPFIFDDPITSLDHIFEERVAKRLIQLSTERQVIVFTHRLAFAQFLNTSVDNYNADAAKCGHANRAKIKHIELRTAPLGQPTGAGYVGNISLPNRLNDMIDADLNHIKKAQQNNDYITADSLMHSLCTRFRNLVELGIEKNLLSGVVMRFNRNISTLMLPRLYAISKDDILIFHKLMTKYSAFDHSQSIETPVALPKLDDIEADLRMLSEWSKDFKKRCDEEEAKEKGKK